MNSRDSTSDLTDRKTSESSEKSEKTEKAEKAKIRNSTPRNSDEEKEGKNLKDLNTTQDLIDQANRVAIDAFTLDEDLDDEPHVAFGRPNKTEKGERSWVMLSHKQDVRKILRVRLERFLVCCQDLTGQADRMATTASTTLEPRVSAGKSGKLNFMDLDDR